MTTLREDAVHGIISKESPLGRAVMGRRVGDRVIVTTGASAYLFMRDAFDQNVPVDAVIVGIIDEDVSL